MVAEGTGVDLVHIGKVRYICHEDGRLDDVAMAAPLPASNAAKLVRACSASALTPPGTRAPPRRPTWPETINHGPARTTACKAAAHPAARGGRSAMATPPAIALLSPAVLS